MNSSHSHISQLAESLNSRSTFQVVLESSIFGSIASIAFIGNLLVLYIVYKTPRLRTVPGLFVSSLALSETAKVCLGIPPSLLSLIRGRWTSGFATCQFQGFVFITTVSAVLLTMALMSVDRYFRVVRPTKHRVFFTMPRAQLMTAGVWVLAATGPIPYIANGNKYIFHAGKFFCLQNQKPSVDSGLIYLYLSTSLIVLTFCYSNVLRHLRLNTIRVQNLCAGVPSASERENVRISAKEIKLTRTLVVTFLGCLICGIPGLVIDFLDISHGGWCQSRAVYVFYSNMGLASSCLNPFIYGALNRTFRREYKKLVCFRKFFIQDPINLRGAAVN